MSEIIGAAHFLTLVGLWSVWLERKIEPWPEWTVILAFVILEVGIVAAAVMVTVAYV
jgi:hypothetical protein